MSRDAQLLEQKIKDVKQYFSQLNSITEYGVKKHTIAWCTAKTAEKFYLRPKTVENYIYSR
jgi:hypothetical protein